MSGESEGLVRMSVSAHFNQGTAMRVKIRDTPCEGMPPYLEVRIIDPYQDGVTLYLSRDQAADLRNALTEAVASAPLPGAIPEFLPDSFFDDYQEWAASKWRGDGSDWDQVVNATLGIAGEAGEIAETLKKQRFHAQAPSSEEVTLEMGDLLFYLATLARLHGISLSAVAAGNVRKLDARFPTGFSEEAAQARADERGEPGAPGAPALETALSGPVPRTVLVQDADGQTVPLTLLRVEGGRAVLQDEIGVVWHADEEDIQECGDRFDPTMHAWTTESREIAARHHGDPFPWRTSPIFCNHANESPSHCPCRADCYCRLEGNCERVAYEGERLPREVEVYVLGRWQRAVLCRWEQGSAVLNDVWKVRKELVRELEGGPDGS